MENSPRRVHPKKRSMLDKRPAPGFNIVVEEVVGRVTFGEGDLPVVQAAFNLIGAHVAETQARGTFTFPHEDGGTVRIEVTHDQNASTDKHDLQ